MNKMVTINSALDDETVELVCLEYNITPTKVRPKEDDSLDDDLPDDPKNMNNINISLAEVSECASRIRILNQAMYEHLNAMRKEMNSLNVSWLSESGETIRQKFNQFAGRFDSQKEQIDSYARFLDQTVSSYDSLETTINSNASGIQS